MADCLIVTTLANEFAAEIARMADPPIAVKACVDAAQALDEYTDERILFGSPGMLVDCLPAMPTVEWVQSSWAGVTPLIELDRRDYQLTGVKDVFGSQMAEYVLGYLLAHELKILERRVAQDQRQWLRSYSGTLEGRSLGILGTGSIGCHIANAARCLGVRVRGLSRSGRSQADFEQVFPVAELHPFLDGLDYLVSTLPQTPDTDGLLDAEALATLPEHAYLINVGRSNVLDDRALIDALRTEKLAGAALDVFDEEPLPQDDPLWSAPNVAITAHISAVSHPLLIVPIFVENYRRFVTGEPLRYRVDFDAGY